MFIFSIVAGLSAGFLIANAIAGSVLAQTRQIGLLKAVGFTRLYLGLTYLTEYLGLALLASLTGLAIGIPAAMLILRELAAKFGEALLWPPLGVVLTTPLSVLVLAAIFTLLPVRRAVRLDTVTAIRTGQERHRGRGAPLPNVSIPLAIGIKDTLSHRLRFALTASGLGMAIFAMTVALSLNATVEGFFTDPKYGARRDSDLFLGRSAYFPDEEAQRLIEEQPDIIASYGLVWNGFQFPGEERVYWGRFFEGDLREFELGVMEGHMLQSEGEAVIGYNLAAQRDLQIGDTMNVLIDGRSASVTVVGVYREMNNMGQMIMFSLDLLRHTQPDAAPFSYSLRLRPGADEDAIMAALTSASNYQLDIRSAKNIAPDNSTTAMRQMVAWLAVILTALTTLGVFNSVWMSIQERRREMALLKAVGMTPDQMTLSVLTGAGLIAVLSYVVGLPVGVIGTYVLTDAVGRWVGYGPLAPEMSLPGLVLMFPVIVLVAVVGALLPAYRAGRTSTVEMLRYE